MARIELRRVAHRYNATDSTYAVQPLDLIWDDGGAYALLGPSGCGKSTLLGIISGLLRPTEGSVWIDDRDVTTLAPRERNVAQVFQFPVLYDTMTVFDNLAFPLRNRRVKPAEVRSRVEQIAALLDLSSELSRTASGLPGDLKQRIALGRGLVRKDVAAILLDEPLTVIDPHLRWQLRRKLMEIHAELKVTLIYVTHDQLEALTLADQVVVMREGYVLQQGTPAELFERPEHTFVGHFIGSPGMNVLPCTIANGTARIAGQTVSLPRQLADSIKLQGECEIGIRPEFLRLTEEPPKTAAARVIVKRLAELGGFNVASVELGEHTVHVKTRPEQQPALGTECWLEFPDEQTHVYQGGRLIE
ncbi:MAG TPA: ABC transporter ATP-binding protein [Polyangiales bacterium]|nr:ABC transporter ATP-binding protein [Polyangiales bacterium]